MDAEGHVGAGGSGRKADRAAPARRSPGDGGSAALGGVAVDEPGPRDDGSRPETASSRIERAASSPAALVVAAGWGAAEASVFFLVPDLWVGFVGLFAPRRTGKAFVAAVVGALVGSTALWWLAPSLPGLGGVISSLPGIRPTDLEGAGRELSHQGLTAFLSGPFQGQPMKLYVHEAALLGEPLPLVLGFVVLNRIERVGPAALATAVIGTVFRGRLARRWRAALIAYIASWAAGYAVYFAWR